MAATLDRVKAYIGATSAEHDPMLTDMLDEATELVDHYIGQATVPTTIRTHAIVAVTADLWNRRSAPNGIVQQQFPGADTEPVRIARDPMRPAYPILRRWVLPWAEAAG